jgi:hypothetical protein
MPGELAAAADQSVALVERPDEPGTYKTTVTGIAPVLDTQPPLRKPVVGWARSVRT